MDENTWRCLQIVMWAIGLQSTLLGGIFIFFWNNLSKRIDEVSTNLKKEITSSSEELRKEMNASSTDLKKEMNALSVELKKDINDLSTKIDKVDARIDKVETRLESLQHSFNELDKRVYGIETVLHMKDCCVLKQDQNLKKAE